MASRRSTATPIAGAALLALGLALSGCQTEAKPGSLNGVQAVPGGQLAFAQTEVTPEEAGYAWNYPQFPQRYEVDPLQRQFLSDRTLAENGSYAGPWLEGAEAKELPVGQPNVVGGAAVAKRLGARLTAALKPTLEDSPFQAYLKLKNGLTDVQPALTRDQLWDLTFHLYKGLEPDFTKAIPTRLDPASQTDPQKRKSGAQIFGANCAMCHGAAGWGDGKSGKTLQPPPANFHEPRRLYNRSEAHLYSVLHEGIYGSAMPPWKDKLSEDEIHHVVAFIRSLSYSTEPPVSAGDNATPLGSDR
jgi:mono/diheme cytochrome c family protein